MKFFIICIKPQHHNTTRIVNLQPNRPCALSTANVTPNNPSSIFYLNKSKIKANFLNYTVGYNTNLVGNSQHVLIGKLITNFLKKGLKKKKIVNLTKLFCYFFNFLKFKDLYVLPHVKETVEIHNHNFNLNKNLYLINFVLAEIVKILNPAFNLKLISKKKKKKNQAKMSSKISYVFPKKRISLIYRWIYYYANSFPDKSSFSRLFKAIFYTYVERRRSFLYVKKLEVYNKYMSSKRRKKE